MTLIWGEFWCGQTVLWANYKYNRTVKQVASIAHTLGGKVVGAEAFTSEPDADKWLQYPYALKSLGDYMFTRGLSRIYFIDLPTNHTLLLLRE